MNRLQWIVVGLSVALFAILYFGFDLKTEAQQRQIELRSAELESTDITLLRQAATDSLAVADRNDLRILEQQVELSKTDSAKAEAYIELSSFWYRIPKLAIAGYYAQEVAAIRETEEAWSIAGTTYAICTQRETAQQVKQFCAKRAFKAFENAISINPDNIQHKVNLALTYLETENPMTGVQMLLQMNRENPENTLVLNTLGDQSLRSNQLDKAEQRYLSVLALESNNQRAICALVEVYNRMQQPTKAQLYQDRCNR